MSIQRISFIERNIEKILFAAAGVGLVGVLAWQIAGPRTTVEVGSKKDVPLSDAYPELQKSATQLSTLMNRKEVPELPERPKSSIVKTFNERLAASVSTGGGWSSATAAPKPNEDPVDLGKGGVTFYRAPAIGAPATPKAVAFMQTVSAAEVEAAVKADPAAAQLFPAKAPFDKAAVSIQTSFDGAKLRALFDAVPDEASKTRPLPHQLWDSMQIVRVQLERQELKADGSWTDVAPVAPMPGRENLAPQLNGFNAGNIGDLVKYAAEHEDGILRPAFYDRAMLAGKSLGAEWVPPEEMDQAVGNDAEVSKLKRELRDIDKWLRMNEIEISRAKAEGVRPPGGGGGGGGGGLGGGGRSGGGKAGGGGGGGGGAGSPPKTNPAEEKVKRLEEARKKQLDRKADLEGKLKQLGAPDKVKKEDVKPADINLSRLFQNSDINIWGHDITVARGKTYRYRARLWFTNPLIGQGARMDPAENAIAAQPTLASKESEWSDPVKVDDDSYYFVTSTTAMGNKNVAKSATAGVELYTFTWGYWRRGTSSLQPGDVVAAKITIPDAIEIEKIAPNPAPGTPANVPAGPGGGPGFGPGGGGPGGGGKGMNPLVPGPGAAPGPAGAKAPPAQKAPEMQIDLVRDAFLVDVVSSVVEKGSSKPTDSAYLRESGGVIVVRTPDASLPDFKRLRDSAAAGEQSLRTLFEPEVAPAAGPGLPPMPPPGRPGAPGRENPGNPGGGFGG